MFYTEWIKKDNLIKLVEVLENDELNASFPRPVFSDELLLLGFDTRFNFPKEDGVPICWAVERKYYYCGDLIATAKTADLYHKPVIAFSETRHRTLKPIDVEKLIRINREELFIIENEALDFIKSIYEKYNKTFDAFASAFSGGKDSQVVLDLVSRALGSKTYYASFTDTGMELPVTLETVQKTKEKYSKKFAGFKMIECHSFESAEEQWRKYGPPSRFSRWCCSVRKSGLFTRTMKDVLKTNRQPRIVVFEGVRADESSRREKYDRVGKGVKHVNLINARPIFYWNNFEIYLYCLEQGVDLNPAYKKGLTRVGCNICPFASSWSESLIGILYPDLVAPYVDVIRNLALGVGLKNEEKIRDYISSGNWKKNAGGKGLNADESRFDIISQKPNLECVLTHPKSDWRVWLSVVGEFLETTNTDGSISGEIKLQSGIKKFKVVYKNDKIIFKFNDIGDKIFESSIIKKALTKTTYCERCGVCEAECPTGALVVRHNKLEVDKKRCVHCYSCINVDTCGCIIAARRKVSEGGIMSRTNNVRTSGVDKYSTFGLRDPWINSFFEEFDDFFIDYAGLGAKQITAVLNWLREAELVDLKVKKQTEFANELKEIYDSRKFLAHQIIWINLCFNSAVVRNYVLNLSPFTTYSLRDVVAMMQNQYPDVSENTLKNPVGALANMFRNSSFGCEADDQEFVRDNLKMGVISKINNETYFTKVGVDTVSPGAILYILYKIAEEENKYEFTVSDFYNNVRMGPKAAFNMSYNAFCNALRSLDNDGFLRAELVAGLDNIHLFEKFYSKGVLKQWWEKHK